LNSEAEPFQGGGSGDHFDSHNLLDAVDWRATHIGNICIPSSVQLLCVGWLQSCASLSGVRFESGSRLSGIQESDLCLETLESRAILVNAPILLLDEATAALDAQSEQFVQQSLEVVRDGKTAVVVARRLAPVLHADRILVFSDGHMQESGKHEELLEQSRITADLVKCQLE
jgi:ABC-type transport system involved in cytochrome bd biosynthesis fused ATPase/permease subunit